MLAFFALHGIESEGNFCAHPVGGDFPTLDGRLKVFHRNGTEISERSARHANGFPGRVFPTLFGLRYYLDDFFNVSHNKRCFDSVRLRALQG